MAKAKKSLFNKNKEQNLMDKQIVENLIKKLQERLKKKEDVQKATLIIEQWINESEDLKTQKNKKKSA